MAAYVWADIVQVVVVALWWITFGIFVGAAFSLNYPALELEDAKLYNIDTTDRDACIAAATDPMNPSSKCVKSFYVSRAWKTWTWWVLYFTPIVCGIELAFISLYLKYQKYGIFWFIAAAVCVIGAVWFVIWIIQTSVWWAKCEDHAFCSNAKYVYDFTDTVDQDTAARWIVYCVMGYLIVVWHLALLIISIVTQACVSRYVREENVAGGRRSLLDPLVKRSDAESIAATRAESQRIDSGIDSSAIPMEYRTPGTKSD